MISLNQEIELTASSIDAEELFSDVEDIDVDEEVKKEPESVEEVKSEESEVVDSKDDNEGEEDSSNEEDAQDEDLSSDEIKEIVEEDIVKELADKMADADVEEEEEEEEVSYPSITSITGLGRILRNEGYKLTVFNVKDTLIRYLELFGERKIARHVVDQDGHTFYEIHAVYIPGAVIFQLLSKIGFKPLHPTDLDDNYPKDMRYEVAMSNGQLFINVFGGLQQHAPTEETVIRNLYEWEKKRYGVGIATASADIMKPAADVEISKNLMLAAMQSFSLDKRTLAYEFFEQAMHSNGIDEFINTLSGPSSFERQPSFVEISDAVEEDDEDTQLTDDERIEALEPKESGELFKYE